MKTIPILKLNVFEERGYMVKGNNKFIYGYEIGTILGINKRKSLKELCLEKVNKLSHNRKIIDEKEEELYWSDTLKDLLSKEFTIRSGKKVRKELKIIVDEEYEFMHSKIDRRIVGENSILVCSAYNNDIIKDEIDENIFLECQHNIRVTKADKCYAAFLINDKRFYFKEIERDEVMIAKIVEAEKAFFYNHILKEILP